MNEFKLVLELSPAGSYVLLTQHFFLLEDEHREYLALANSNRLLKKIVSIRVISIKPSLRAHLHRFVDALTAKEHIEGVRVRIQLFLRKPPFWDILRSLKPLSAFSGVTDQDYRKSVGVYQAYRRRGETGLEQFAELLREVKRRALPVNPTEK